MFGKKKANLFGNGIEQDCAYCVNFSDGVCCLDQKGTPCNHFCYDPLKRTPDNVPPLKEHDPEEFKL